MLRMTSVFRSIHKWFEQNPNRICQGPKPSTMHMYFIDWSHTNYDRNSNSGKCRGENTSQNGMIWHILAQVFYTCSGVDFFPPFTICGAHNIRILDLGKHLTQEFELYNLYPGFFTCHTICENLENEEHF